VLVDLKTGELTHQDIGQMDMYVRLFEDTIKSADDNPSVGIILCTEKDHTVVKYSVHNENRQLFASKYMLYLPTEEVLRQELERERALVVREQRAQYAVLQKSTSSATGSEMAQSAQTPSKPARRRGKKKKKKKKKKEGQACPTPGPALRR